MFWKITLYIIYFNNFITLYKFIIIFNLITKEFLNIEYYILKPLVKRIFIKHMDTLRAPSLS